MNPSTIIEQARTEIALLHPFFASLLFKRPVIETDCVPYAAVRPDGQILFNPNCVNELNKRQLIFLLCHEILHVALGHNFRQGSRDARRWNIACDAVINELLIQAGIGQFIEGGVRWSGGAVKTAEQIYDELPKGGGDGNGGDGEGSGGMRDPYGSGNGKGEKLRDLMPEDGKGSEGDGFDKAREEGHGEPMSAEEREAAERGAQMDTAEAHNIERMRGAGSSAISRCISEVLKGRPLPWHEQLARYMQKLINQGISWRRPNKRFIPYLPVTDHEPSMGRVIVGIDTSGSISSRELGAFEKHSKDMFEQCHPSQVTVVYCDDAVGHVDDFEELGDFELKPRGGGGTDMRKITKWCNDDCGDPIDCCVIFTDGYTPFPNEREMDIATVWVITTDVEVPSHLTTIRFKLED